MEILRIIVDAVYVLQDDSEGVCDCTIPSSFAKASEDKPSEHRSKAQNAPREPQNKKNLRLR